MITTLLCIDPFTVMIYLFKGVSEILCKSII